MMVLLKMAKQFGASLCSATWATVFMVLAPHVSNVQAQPVAPLVLKTPQQVLNENIEVLGTPFELKALPAQNTALTRLVFYRHPAQSTPAAAMAVYVQGQLHTALSPGGYSALCLPAGLLNIRVRQSQHMAQVSLDGQAANTLFITFTKADGLLAIQSVDEPQAMTALQDLRLQSNTLSRVRAALPCEASTPAKTEPAANTAAQQS